MCVLPEVLDEYSILSHEENGVMETFLQGDLIVFQCCFSLWWKAPVPL